MRLPLVLLLLSGVMFSPSLSSGVGSELIGGRRELIDLEQRYRESVLKGWRYFQTSFARDGMACVNCHLSYEQMTGWAGAYPKVQVFDGTPFAVKSLRDVVLEAMGKHTDLPEAGRMKRVDDLVAFIAWWGDGQDVTPGLSRAQAPAAADQRELENSVERGRALFMRNDPPSCSQCHIPEPGGTKTERLNLDHAVTGFPRYDEKAGRVLSFKSFLLRHGMNHKLRLDPDQITDVQAYLASQASGTVLKPGGTKSASK